VREEGREERKREKEVSEKRSEVWTGGEDVVGGTGSD
jgi:hypothetical protein